jgi:hypothetical protein
VPLSRRSKAGLATSSHTSRLVGCYTRKTGTPNGEYLTDAPPTMCEGAPVQLPSAGSHTAACAATFFSTCSHSYNRMPPVSLPLEGAKRCRQAKSAAGCKRLRRSALEMWGEYVLFCAEWHARLLQTCNHARPPSCRAAESRRYDARQTARHAHAARCLSMVRQSAHPMFLIC